MIIAEPRQNRRLAYIINLRLIFVPLSVRLKVKNERYTVFAKFAIKNIFKRETIIIDILIIIVLLSVAQKALIYLKVRSESASIAEGHLL